MRGKISTHILDEMVPWLQSCEATIMTRHIIENMGGYHGEGKWDDIEIMLAVTNLCQHGWLKKIASCKYENRTLNRKWERKR